MKTIGDTSRILIATDSIDVGDSIMSQLEAEFTNLSLSTDGQHAVRDFDAYRPDVVVLAFDRLEKAQRYYLGLYRGGASLPPNGHRTVLLCAKDEVRAAVDLCKREYFDDYVLYWPQTYDGFRLVMSILIACREIAALKASGPRPLDLLAHAKHVADLDRILDRKLTDREEDAVDARQALRMTEREIEGSMDIFSDRLTKRTSDAVDVTDAVALAREIADLKAHQIALARHSDAVGAELKSAWTRNLRKEIEPALAGTRVLAEEVRKIRPVVMVVEDDEFARQLLLRTLDPEEWDAIFAANGEQAMGQLRRVRPDVILMDIRLPGVDGVALTQRIKASPHLANIPVIMMTGDARKETLESSMAAGAAAFVVKPFTRELLTAKLARVLPR